MPLPIQADLADIEAICGYLLTKPAGASLAELVDEKAIDRRKLSALKFWGLIEDAGTKLRLSERGLLVARDNGAKRVGALREVARAVQNKEAVVLSSEVAAHWQRHFRAYTQFGILTYQVVCFFRVAEGADLGGLVVGRKGKETRLELAEENARAFINGADLATDDEEDCWGSDESGSKQRVPSRGNRVFITRRMNGKIVEQVKELVAFGKFDPVVAGDRESMMDEMRGCDTAVIHVSADGSRFDVACNEEPRISGDVLIEIGAAMALYGRNFILLVEEGVTLPASLQGLCECRYRGEELDMPATMRLFKAFNNFPTLRPARPLAFSANHPVPQVLQYERVGTSAQAKN
jgi:hypothetical protein